MERRLRLRALVGAAGTPVAVSSEPFDVLENGVAGARWTVADASETDPQLNDARAGLLRTLQARVGVPALRLQQVLVRLPRRLSGTRREPGWRERKRRGNNRALTSTGALVVMPYPRVPVVTAADSLRWIRGTLPAEPDLALPPLQGDSALTAAWEHAYPGRGLGRPRALRRRRRRWQTIDLHDPFTNRWADRVIYGDLLPGPPFNSEAVAREVGRVVSAAGARASDVRVEGGRVRFTATIERPLDEAPELPRLGPNDPNQHGVDPAPELLPLADVELTVLPPQRPPRATFAALRRAASELAARGAQTNADGTYNAHLGPAAMYELRSDPEFQRLAMGLLYDNHEADGSILSIEGLRLFERRGSGWSVEPGGARVDFRIDLSQAAPAVSFGPGLRQTAPIAEFRVISRPDRGLRLTLQASARSTAVFVDALVTALRDQPRALAMVDVLGSRLALRSFQQQYDDRRAALHVDLDLVEPPRWAS